LVPDTVLLKRVQDTTIFKGIPDSIQTIQKMVKLNFSNMTIINAPRVYKGLMTYDLKMVQCFTEPLYNNLKTEFEWKQKHNTMTMFSSYNYISNAVFLIKKKERKKERKRKSQPLTLVVTV